MSRDNLIAEALDATGWTKADLARRLGAHKDTVQDWAQDRMQPRPGVYADLHQELLQTRQKIDDLIERIKERAAPRSITPPAPR